MAESQDRRARAQAEAGVREGSESDWEACFTLLPAVSRTFALGIAQLQSPLREATCAAYLLCRAVDTFEDAVGLTPEQKGGWIHLLRQDVDAGQVTSGWPL